MQFQQFQQFILSFEQLLFSREYKKLQEFGCQRPTTELCLLINKYYETYQQFPDDLRQLVMFQFEPCIDDCPYAVGYDESVTILEYGIRTFNIVMPCQMIFICFMHYLTHNNYPSIIEIFSFAQEYGPASPIQRQLQQSMTNQVDEFWAKKSSGLTRDHFPFRELTEQHKEQCAICQEPMKQGEKVITLPCTHTFHSKQDGCDGIEDWYTKMNNCPLCKHEF
jgi:hypothetical protein